MASQDAPTAMIWARTRVQSGKQITKRGLHGSLAPGSWFLTTAPAAAAL